MSRDLGKRLVRSGRSSVSREAGFRGGGQLGSATPQPVPRYCYQITTDLDGYGLSEMKSSQYLENIQRGPLAGDGILVQHPGGVANRRSQEL
jgi:hypothetical protein